MSILYLLIPLAAVLVIIAAAFFIWSIRSGQFEDLEGPGFRILMDDDEHLIPDDAKVKRKATPPDAADKGSAQEQQD
ncbi:MAG: cbb3-type cytochrome oxidase assembly protein CcoS [Chromatiales bacterium]|jgi:cbb3-type cytochrome oxidase maturation protein